MLGPAEAPVDPLERNKAVVRRFLEEVVNTGDTARLADFIPEACVEADGQVRVPSGIPGMAAPGAEP